VNVGIDGVLNVLALARYQWRLVDLRTHLFYGCPYNSLVTTLADHIREAFDFPICPFDAFSRSGRVGGAVAGCGMNTVVVVVVTDGHSLHTMDIKLGMNESAGWS
jgi:hypothetical protein